MSDFILLIGFKSHQITSCRWGDW